MGEGAPCKLPRLGEARTIVEQGLGHAIDNPWPAMEMQLGAILAGIASGPGKPDHERSIQHGAALVPQGR